MRRTSSSSSKNSANSFVCANCFCCSAQCEKTKTKRIKNYYLATTIWNETNFSLQWKNILQIHENQRLLSSNVIILSIFELLWEKATTILFYIIAQAQNCIKNFFISAKVIILTCITKFSLENYSSNGSNNIWSLMFDRLKPKIGCSSSITIRWTRSSSFDVQKKGVRVSSMSNLANLVKAL